MKKKLLLILPGGQTIYNPSGFRADRFTDLGSFLTQLFNVAFYIAFFLMFFWLAWGVFEYLFAGGEKEKLGKAQKRITWAIIGFLLVVVAFILKDYLQTLFPQQLPGGVTPVTVPK